MILATNHGPAIIRAKLVDFCGRVFLKALGDLEVGETLNKNLKTKSFTLVWSTSLEERASGPSDTVADPSAHKSGLQSKISKWKKIN